MTYHSIESWMRSLSQSPVRDGEPKSWPEMQLLPHLPQSLHRWTSQWSWWLSSHSEWESWQSSCAKVCKKLKLCNTVKPELTATFEQRPPVNNGKYNLVMASIKSTFIRTPLSNGHFFQVPRVAVVHRFDCTYFISHKWKKNVKKIEQK